MSGNRSIKIMAAVAASFTVLVSLILGLLIARVISLPLGLLMCVSLVGLYVGFGFLALVARLVSKLR